MFIFLGHSNHLTPLQLETLLTEDPKTRFCLVISFTCFVIVSFFSYHQQTFVSCFNFFLNLCSTCSKIYLRLVLDVCALSE